MGLNIAITSKYNPFTYEDYIKPTEQYWEDYDKAEQDIASAKSDLAKIDAYMEEVKETDADLYGKYTKYKNDLAAISDSLNSSGFTTDIRNKLRDLPTTYNSTILPIIEGLGKLNEYKKGVSGLRNKGVIVVENQDNNKLSTHMGLKVPYENKTITRDEVAQLSEEMTKNITSQMDPSFTAGLSGLVVTNEGIKPGDILKGTLNDEQQRTVNTIRNHIKDSIASRLGASNFNRLNQNVQRALSEEIDNGIITGATYTTSVTKASQGGNGAGNGNQGDGSGNGRKKEALPIQMYVGTPADLDVDPTKPDNGNSSSRYKNAEIRFNNKISTLIDQYLPEGMDVFDREDLKTKLFNQYKSGTVHSVYKDTGGMYYYYVKIPKYKKEGNKYVQETGKDGKPIYYSIPVATSSYKDQFDIPNSEDEGINLGNILNAGEATDDKKKKE